MLLQCAQIHSAPLNVTVSTDSQETEPAALTLTNAPKMDSVEIIQSASTSLVVQTVFAKTVIPTPMAGALISMSVGMMMLVATCIPALIPLALSNVAAPMDGLLFQELMTVNALTSMNVSMKTSTTA